MRQLWAVWVTVALAGCGPYAGVQAELAGQGREGLRRVEAARRGEAEAVAKYLAERRRRLDEAFDADARGRPALDAAWVIEARKAYATGLETLATARATQAENDRAAADTAREADEALALLGRMLRTQQRIGGGK